MDAPPLLLKSEDKLLIVLSHLSILIGVGLLFPLIVFLVKKDDSPAVAYHAREALNFHLSLIVYLLCCVPLVLIFIGVFLMLGIAVGAAVLSIIAAVSSVDGAHYQYPLTIRFVK